MNREKVEIWVKKLWYVVVEIELAYEGQRRMSPRRNMGAMIPCET